MFLGILIACHDPKVPVESSWTPPTYTGLPEGESTWNRGEPGTPASTGPVCDNDLRLVGGIFWQVPGSTEATRRLLTTDPSCSEASSASPGCTTQPAGC